MSHKQKTIAFILTFCYFSLMLFLRNKKHQKRMNAIWSAMGILIIASMLLLYVPAFIQ